MKRYLAKTKAQICWAPDDGGMGGGGDGEVAFEPLDTSSGITFEDLPEEPAEPEEFKGKSRADLIKEMDEREKAFAAQRSSLEAQASQTAALQGAFAGLAEKLEKVAKAPQGQPTAQGMDPQKPYESPEQFNERIQQSLLVNPVQALTEVGERVFGPTLQQQAIALQATSKELVRLRPETKPIYEKYGAEIDALAATAPNNPRAYLEATEIVASRHRSELVAEEAAALAERLVNEKLAALGYQASATGTSSPQVSKGPHVETSVPKGPRIVNGRRVVQATPSQRAQWQRAADAKVMTIEDYYKVYVDNWQAEV